MKIRTTAILTVVFFGFAGFTGCSSEKETETMTKEEAAGLAKTDMFSDFCEWFGWYGDGICDTFCLYPDPDCEEEQDCYVGGCSGQICSAEKDVISTCEWTAYYGCYELATCDLLPSGNCGWIGVDSRFQNCLYDEGACPYYSLPPPWWCDGGRLVDVEQDAIGCPRPPMCVRDEGATCGGEHDFQCDGGFFCVDGTCTRDQPCYVGGWTSQLCTDDRDMVSTCEWTDYYGCYEFGRCELLPSGNCRWVGDSNFENCLYDEGACPYYSLPPEWWCDGGELVPQDPDELGCPVPPGCQRGTGATCGGEHEFVCDEGFECVDGTCE